MPVRIIPISELPPRPNSMVALQDAQDGVFHAIEEGDELDFQLAIEEVDRIARRIKMTEQQKREYALYRRACVPCGVVANRADFLLGEWDSAVELEMNYRRKFRREGLKALAASA